jgi:hypothetical protein
VTEKELKIKKALFLEVLPKKGYHIGKTCKAVGIGRRTFYNWKEDDEQFAEDYEEEIQSDIDDSEEKMKLLRQGVPKFDKDGKFIGWIERPHFQALALHLQSKAKDRGWGQSIEVTRKVDDGRQLSDEELLAEIQNLGKQVTDGEWDTSKDGTGESE